MDLALLFVSALAASTILPMSSEAVLAAMAIAEFADRALLFLVATGGNTLGAVANWAIGRYAATWRTRLLSLDDARSLATSGLRAGSIAGASGAFCSAGCP